MDRDTLNIVMNGEVFGRRQSERIVGGAKRLGELIGKGLIRAEKRSSSQNGKWYCNAADVLRNAQLKF